VESVLADAKASLAAPVSSLPEDAVAAVAATATAIEVDPVTFERLIPYTPEPFRARDVRRERRGLLGVRIAPSPFFFPFRSFIPAHFLPSSP